MLKCKQINLLKMQLSYYNQVCLLLFILEFGLSVIKNSKKGIFKAFLIGSITPLFFYNFAIKFVNSMGYFLYISGFFRDSHGVLYLIFAFFVKPLSVFLGIIITLILLVEDDFINELKNSFNYLK
ncbi:hypothetical protein Xen7305DRAFT_00041940 [Xenococcus sp. PCC 7305]|nr:hypothetical protein Xen7305DRAFT_00041940 [Xenococcus sp. PCC 7305]